MNRACLVIVTSVAALALAACRGSAPVTEPPAAAAAQGERFTVRLKTIADVKPVAATVATRDTGEARARIGGTLVRLLVREGDYVAKGQLIGVVNDQRLRFETSAYDAQAAAAAAEATRADAELGRIETLYRKGIYAKARLEMAQAAARSASGVLAAARAQRAASAEMSAQGAILAPTAGRVLHAAAPAGSVVSAGQSIATITAGAPLLRLEIPEAQALALRAGDAVSLVAGDMPEAASTGTIAQVYPAVTGGMVVADIVVPGLRADLVGRRVRVRIRVGERPALVVPARFVSTRFGIDFVRVIGSDGRASEVAVQVAPGADGGLVEVLSGLSDGDVILATARPR